jgi:hypothetical protein
MQVKQIAKLSRADLVAACTFMVQYVAFGLFVKGCAHFAAGTGK